MIARPAAVADMFYPAEAATLERTVAELLAAAPAGEDDAKAIIAPHAGYQFSGPTAARAYRLFEGRRERIRRVVLLGPAHRVYLHGMALPSVDAFTTPLGDVPIDADGVRQALAMPGTQISDEAHAAEHSLDSAWFRSSSASVPHARWKLFSRRYGVATRRRLSPVRICLTSILTPTPGKSMRKPPLV
jgi:predicted class III extradiol MEMO1 family dioxygenase